MDRDTPSLLFTAEEGTTLWLPLLTGSMAPALMPGEELEIRVDRKGKPRWGEVILFFREGKFTSHRVYMRRPGSQLYYEKGDANGRGSWIEQDRIFGRVVRVRGASGEIRAVERKPFLVLSFYTGRLFKKIIHTIKKRLPHG